MLGAWMKMLGNFAEILVKFRILGVVDMKSATDYWLGKKLPKKRQNCRYNGDISAFSDFLPVFLHSSCLLAWSTRSKHTLATLHSSCLLGQLGQSTKMITLHGKGIQTHVKRFKLNPWQPLSQLCSSLYMDKYYYIK